MNKSTVLFVGFSEDSVAVLEKEFATGWISNFADTNETAIEKFQQLHYDAVIANDAGEGLETLKKLFTMQQPQLLFMKTGSILTPDEVLKQITANKMENKPAISYNDDALKNAGLHINIQ